VLATRSTTQATLTTTATQLRIFHHFMSSSWKRIHERFGRVVVFVVVIVVVVSARLCCITSRKWNRVDSKTMPHRARNNHATNPSRMTSDKVATLGPGCCCSYCVAMVVAFFLDTSRHRGRGFGCWSTTARSQHILHAQTQTHDKPHSAHEISKLLRFGIHHCTTVVSIRNPPFALSNHESCLAVALVVAIAIAAVARLELQRRDKLAMPRNINWSIVHSKITGPTMIDIVIGNSRLALEDYDGASFFSSSKCRHTNRVPSFVFPTSSKKG